MKWKRTKMGSTAWKKYTLTGDEREENEVEEATTT